MSFTTEDPDTVNSSLAETLAQIRADVDAGKFAQESKPRDFSRPAYWPSHPSASHHHTYADTKWDDDMHSKE